MRWTPRWQNFQNLEIPLLRKTQGSTSVRSLRERHHQYVMFFTFSMLLGSLLFWIPSLYITHQNQKIVTSLYLEQNPSLILGLDQEFLWLKISFVVALACVGFCAYILTQRMLETLEKPLVELEEQLQKLIEDPMAPIDLDSQDYRNHKLYQLLGEYIKNQQEMRHEDGEILANMQIPIADKKNFMLLDVLKRRWHVDQTQLPIPGEQNILLNESSSRPAAVASGRLVS